MTFQEWQDFSRQVDGRARRITMMIVDRARRVASQSGLSPEMPFMHAHNYLVSCSYGRPWPEVNHSGARLIRHLEQRSFEPGRIAERITRRAWDRVER